MSMSGTMPRKQGNVHQHLASAMNQVNRVLLGKPHQVKLAFTCLIAGGHLLLEDIPGVGKTTLVHALAASFALKFKRVQFTSDMMPTDIIGVNVYERETARFRFHPGPIFSELLLADEINRATPKTQSALLEAMAENQVTVDGQTRKLPKPFFVVATQNPLDMSGGTFALPDSQLDRFMLCLSLGYPKAAAERALLESGQRHALLTRLTPQLNTTALEMLNQHIQKITVSDRLLDYVQALLSASRSDPDIHSGLSPRAGLGLLAASRAWALLSGRNYVLPEDVQEVFVPLAMHRIVPAKNSSNGGTLAKSLLTRVAVD